MEQHLFYPNLKNTTSYSRDKIRFFQSLQKRSHHFLINQVSNEDEFWTEDGAKDLSDVP